MAFFDKLNDLAKNISDKTGEAIEINKLNSKISLEKKEIAQLMQKIGEFYYEKYKKGEVSHSTLLEYFTAIDEHHLAVSEAQAEIEQIKAVSESNKTDAPAPAMQSAGILCSSCGAENDSQKKFCSECGAKLEATVPGEKTCTSCGAKVTGNLKFCGECGQRIE